MVTVAEVLSLVLVSLLWGCTNPFLKKGSEGIENVTETNRVFQLLAEIKFLILNINYLVPFLINQSGSLVYFYILSTTGKLLGEEFGGKRAIVGMFLTMTGVTLCIVSSIEAKDADRQNESQPQL
ncbi:transmembrane protein 234 isoform X2 [Gambusia affinis]|uniref:transmembrane protein 234 isoform X2 n=1 Tax=Gambusia affinis TaxID=33528 RepID=UPI001CDCE40C|nr:transmembrane protein 234 isoform X2 [Gambusia affinis]